MYFTVVLYTCTAMYTVQYRTQNPLRSQLKLSAAGNKEPTEAYSEFNILPPNLLHILTIFVFTHIG